MKIYTKPISFISVSASLENAGYEANNANTNNKFVRWVSGPVADFPTLTVEFATATPVKGIFLGGLDSLGPLSGSISDVKAFFYLPGDILAKTITFNRSEDSIYYPSVTTYDSTGSVLQSNIYFEDMYYDNSTDTEDEYYKIVFQQEIVIPPPSNNIFAIGMVKVFTDHAEIKNFDENYSFANLGVYRDETFENGYINRKMYRTRTQLVCRFSSMNDSQFQSISGISSMTPVLSTFDVKGQKEILCGLPNLTDPYTISKKTSFNYSLLEL